MRELSRSLHLGLVGIPRGDDDVDVVGQRLEHAGDLFGPVLEVGVHQHGDVAGRAAQAGPGRGLLTEVPGQVQPDDAVVGFARAALMIFQDSSALPSSTSTISYGAVRGSSTAVSRSTSSSSDASLL